MAEKKRIQKNIFKNIKTVDDLLSQDDINALFQKVLADKPKMVNAIIIYDDNKGGVNWLISKDMLMSNAIYNLEIVKQNLLSQDG